MWLESPSRSVVLATASIVLAVGFIALGMTIISAVL
jgi:hypothetical protein